MRSRHVQRSPGARGRGGCRPVSGGRGRAAAGVAHGDVRLAEAVVHHEVGALGRHSCSPPCRTSVPGIGSAGGGSWRSTRSCTTPHSDRPKPWAYARVTVTCRKPGGGASPCAGRGAPSRGSSGRTPGHDPTVSGWAHRADDSSHAVSEDVCTSGRLLRSPCSELSTLTAEAKVLVDQRKSRDLLAAGCVVVRLREDALPSLSVRPSPLPGNTGALDGAASPQGHGRHPRLDAGTTNRPITRGWMDMDGGVFTYGER